MSEQLDVLLDVASRFDAAAIPYMVSGSMAMNYLRVDLTTGPRGLVTGGHSMRDTPPEIEQIYRAMLMARSGSERLLMGCDLFSTSRELIMSALNERDPTEVRQQLFLRFYGPEFTPAEQARILSSIRTHTCR